MTHLADEIVRPATGYLRLVSALRVVVATLRGGGPLDDWIMVQAPDLWLVQPVGGIVWGLLIALPVLVLPDVKLAGFGLFPELSLVLFLALADFGVRSRARGFGGRVAFYRPRYAVARPLLFGLLMLAPFLPGFAAMLVSGPKPRFELYGGSPVDDFDLRLPLALIAYARLTLLGTSFELNLRFGFWRSADFLSFSTTFANISLLMGHFVVFVIFLSPFALFLLARSFAPDTQYVYGVFGLLSMLVSAWVMVALERRFVGKQATGRLLAYDILILPVFCACYEIADVVFGWSQLHAARLGLGGWGVVACGLSYPILGLRLCRGWIDDLAYAPDPAKNRSTNAAA